MEQKLLGELQAELEQFMDKVHLLMDSFEKKTQQYDTLISAYTKMDRNSTGIIDEYRNTIESQKAEIRQLKDHIRELSNGVLQPDQKVR